MELGLIGLGKMGVTWRRGCAGGHTVVGVDFNADVGRSDK